MTKDRNICHITQPTETMYWELWDELPSPKSYHVFESGKHEITLDFYDKEGEPTEHYLYSEGTSFADAVSKAWLKWYYNTQWLKK